MRLGAVLLVLAVAERPVRADDHLAVGYLASRPLAGASSGLASSASVRWGHRIGRGFEVGVGAELGYSGGDESLTRATLLPSIAWITRWSAIAVRLESAAGPQVVHGRVTLDAVPLRGYETRGFHAELALMLEAAISNRVGVRAGGGAAIDGLYPAGHSSTRASPFVAFAIAFAL